MAGDLYGLKALFTDEGGHGAVGGIKGDVAEAEEGYILRPERMTEGFGGGLFGGSEGGGVFRHGKVERQDLLFTQVCYAAGDAQSKALGAGFLRGGDDLAALQDAHRPDGQELRVAGAGADAVEDAH